MSSSTYTSESRPVLASGVRVRRAVAEDADLCGPICYEAFAAINQQHGFPPDVPSPEAATGFLRAMFSHPGFFSVVAESEGQIVGSNCLDERSAVAGIGPITVLPGSQDRGIGRMLMQAVLDRARERAFPGVRLLQAAFHGRSLCLYTSLGFDAREPISVMQGPPIRKTVDGCQVRIAAESDLEGTSLVCEKVHGHNRAGEFLDSVQQRTASVVERNGRITAYATHLGYFGHAVGESDLDLEALIAAADVFSGPGLLVPTRHSSLFRWCLQNGLRVVYPMTLMTAGLYNEPRGAYLPSILY